MKERNIATCIILSIVTLGIYGIYWMVVLNDETKAAAKDDQFVTGGVAFLLTLVTCGIYGIYWCYKMAELSAKAQENAGVTVKDNKIIYLLLALFGLSIVVYALMQNDLNEIARKNGKVA